MKKLVALALLVGMVAAFGFSPAHAGTTTGTILVPTNPSAINDVNGTFTRQERCAFLVGGHATDGLVGWAVEIDPTEADGTHTWTLSSNTAGATPVVAFYEDLGTCDGVTGPGPSGVSGPFAVGGTVPEFAAFALIVIQDGVNADFTFTVSPAA